MEKKIRKVIFSDIADSDLAEIYEYGLLTFGQAATELFLKNIYEKIHELPLFFLIYPECKYLLTKSKIYRNMIVARYLIIYRIKADKIEVLRAVHGTQSPKTIRAARKIKP